MISGRSSGLCIKKLYKPHYSKVTSNCKIRNIQLKAIYFKKKNFDKRSIFAEMTAKTATEASAPPGVEPVAHSTAVLVSFNPIFTIFTQGVLYLE